MGGVLVKIAGDGSVWKSLGLLVNLLLSDDSKDFGGSGPVW